MKIDNTVTRMRIAVCHGYCVTGKKMCLIIFAVQPTFLVVKYLVRSEVPSVRAFDVPPNGQEKYFIHSIFIGRLRIGVILIEPSGNFKIGFGALRILCKCHSKI